MCAQKILFVSSIDVDFKKIIPYAVGASTHVVCVVSADQPYKRKQPETCFLLTFYKLSEVDSKYLYYYNWIW